MLQHQPIESRISTRDPLLVLFVLYLPCSTPSLPSSLERRSKRLKIKPNQAQARTLALRHVNCISHVVSLNKSVRLSCSNSGHLARRDRGVGQLGRDRPPGRRQPRDFSKDDEGDRVKHALTGPGSGGLRRLCWLLSSCFLLDWLQFWPPARILAHPKSCKLTCVIL